jgi:hypothetical protein
LLKTRKLNPFPSLADRRNECHENGLRQQDLFPHRLIYVCQCNKVHHTGRKQCFYVIKFDIPIVVVIVVLLLLVSFWFFMSLFHDGSQHHRKRWMMKWGEN